MKIIYRIARLELSTLFYSPIAWLVLIIFTVQGGATFTDRLESLLTRMEQGANIDRLTNRIFSVPSYSIYLFDAVVDNLFLYIPLLTMGLISRELSSGSIKLLLSSPVNFPQIVLGKYLAMVVYSFLLILVLSLFMAAGGYAVHALDYTLVLSGLLGLFLLICAFSAIGLFISSLTSYQIVAAIGTMAVVAFLNAVGGLWQDIPVVNDIAYWLSLSERTEQLVSGLVSTKEVFYFLIVIALFITLTILKLSGKRHSKSRLKLAASYGIVMFIVVFLGYISSRPGYIGYYDMTRDNTMTLTPDMQEVVHKLREHPLTITSYVNVLDGLSGSSGFPRHYNENYRQLEKFTRFLPQLEMDYVYFYDTLPSRSKVYRNNPGVHGEALAKKMAAAHGIDFDEVLSPEEIKTLVNLSPEENRYVRQVSYKGKKAFLRLFNDIAHYPYDNEIIGSLQKLADRPFKVGLSTGHGERNLNKDDKDYWKALGARQLNRNSLINRGFEFVSVDADEGELPTDIGVLVIADPGSPFTKGELERILAFMGQGGNMLIMAEPENRTYLEPIVGPLGIGFIPGNITQQNKDLLPSFVIGEVTKEAADKINSKQLDRLFKTNFFSTNVLMPGVVGLEFQERGGFEKTPFIIGKKNTTVQGSSTDMLVDSLPGPNAAKNPVPLAVGLERTVNGKDQRIVVTGDADFMSNAQYDNLEMIASINIGLPEFLFKWLSKDEFALSSYPPWGIDDTLNIDKKGLSWLRIVLLGIIPGLMGSLGAYVLIRRKGK